MLLIDGMAESRILEAMQRGEFDNLPGAGKPLQLDDDATVPEELRVACRILKNAGCLPPELETRREIHDVRQLLVSAAGEEKARATQRLQVLLMRLSMERGTEASFEIEEQYLDRIQQRLARIPGGMPSGSR